MVGPPITQARYTVFAGQRFYVPFPNQAVRARRNPDIRRSKLLGATEEGHSYPGMNKAASPNKAVILFWDNIALPGDPCCTSMSYVVDEDRGLCCISMSYVAVEDRSIVSIVVQKFCRKVANYLLMTANNSTWCALTPSPRETHYGDKLLQVSIGREFGDLKWLRKPPKPLTS